MTNDPIEVYQPSEQQWEFLQKILGDFQRDIQNKTQTFPYLNNRDLGKFWEDCINDYNAFVPQKRSDDEAKPYVSNITRSKVNAFLANLATQLIEAQVVAQNSFQIEDEFIQRVLSECLRYAEDNDGRPSTSGLYKFVESLHTCLVEGTVHIQDDVIDGKCIKEIVPNQEVYVPNFWQPDIQKQPHLIRFQNNISYEEFMLSFGDLENAKYVVAGAFPYVTTERTNFFKNFDVGIKTEKGRVSLIRYWCKKKVGKKTVVLFNIVANGVLLLPEDTESPYKHGFYPIYKTVFEWFDTKFYWGNSLPNKLREDKLFLDGMKTLLRYKAKLHLLPPLVAQNGMHIDRRATAPNSITTITGNIDNVKKFPGIAEPLNQSDIMSVNMAEREADMDSVTPTSAGQSANKEMTAREVLLQDARAQKLYGLFGMMITFLVETGGYIRIRNIIQFFPKNKVDGIAKVSIPNASLRTGRKGTMEVIFSRLPEMTQPQLENFSAQLLREQKKAAQQGVNKEIVYLDPSHLEDLDLYVTVKANPASRKSEEMMKVIDQDTYALLKKDPVIINSQVRSEEVTKTLLRSIGGHWDESRILVAEPTPPPQPQQPQQPLSAPPQGGPTQSEFLGGMRSSMQPARTESPISISNIPNMG